MLNVRFFRRAHPRVSVFATTALCVLLAACAAEGGAGTSSTASGVEGNSASTPTPPTQALELVKAAPVNFAGTSTKNTKAFTVGTPLGVDYTFSGSGNFIVSLTGSDGSQLASIANVIGKSKATTWIYGGSGKAHFEVIADGAWKITAKTVVPKAQKIPVTYKGSVSLTTVPFAASGDITIKWSHKGEGNFIVTLIDPTDGSVVDGVANVIGNASDETIAYGQDGLRAFEVVADGAWSLSVTAS